MTDKKISFYKGFAISTSEGQQKGIFFRRPILAISVGVYDGNPCGVTIESFIRSVKKNKFNSFIQRSILKNGNVIDHLNEWMEDMSFAGVKINIFCSPIYFKRDFRKLSAVYVGEEDTLIDKIDSFGYESEFNNCSGKCDTEHTIIHFKSGKSIKEKRNGEYHFTYRHIIKDMIDEQYVK